MLPHRFVLCVVAVVSLASSVAAQTDPAPPQPPPTEHQHDMTASGWMWMYEGVLFAGVNSQGGNRGETQFRSQNWVMGMGSRDLGAAKLTLSAMFSAEPVTVRPEGYSEIFQV